MVSFNWQTTVIKHDGKDLIIVYPDTIVFKSLSKNDDGYVIQFDKFSKHATIYTNKGGDTLCMPTDLKSYFNF